MSPSQDTPQFVGRQGPTITPQTLKFYEFDANPTSLPGGGESAQAVVGRRRGAAAASVPPPPADNMGAEITPNGELENSSKIDWLSFTVPVTDERHMLGVVADYTDFLGGGVPLDFGRHFYKQSRVVLESGRIYFNPERVNMGVHVELPSSALSNLIQIKPNDEAIFTLISKALGDRAVFRRLDIAADNYKIPMSVVANSIESGELITRSRTVDRRHAMRGGRGDTIYIGSKNSDRLVRFYDKAAEQNIDADMTWTRCEVQLRDDLAHQAVMFIMAGEEFESIIVSSVDFRMADSSNTTRRTQCPWWAAWLKSFRRLKFSVSEVVETLARSQAWVMNSVASTLAFIYSAMGENEAIAFFNSVLDDGFLRMTPTKRSWLAAHT